ncbi:MAG: hypothetical protein LUQ25_07555 [Methanoregulaceae archaeon]|nr:hypothetical protein [Methanoregulaceae archaeon]
MKQTALLPAGIIAATILVVMGLGILMTGSFYFMPTVSVDPFTGEAIDENGILVVTGTTNLGLNTHLLVNVSAVPGQVPPAPAAGVHEDELAWPVSGAVGSNPWRAVINTSELAPGDYELQVSSVSFSDDFKTTIQGPVYATKRFVIGARETGAIPGRILPYIRPNPVGAARPDDLVEVTGTTNMEAGTTVLWKIRPAPGETNITGGIGDQSGSTAVTPGIVGINRWAFTLNTTGMEPARYTLLIVAGDIATGDPTGEIASATTDLVLARRASPGISPVQAGYITVDYIPDLPVNTQFILTGTTSLPAGGDLEVEITPLFNETDYEFVVDPKNMAQGSVFSGIVGGVRVEAGPGGTGLWSMEIHTYSLQPARYQVNASNSRMNHTTFMREPGALLGTRTFSVREA